MVKTEKQFTNLYFFNGTLSTQLQISFSTKKLICTFPKTKNKANFTVRQSCHRQATININIENTW